MPVRVRYEEFLPSPRLVPWIRLIWTLEFDDPRSFGPPERILPDGIVEAIFHWGVPFTTAIGGAAAARQPQSFAIAQTRRFIEIAPVGAKRVHLGAIPARRWLSLHAAAGVVLCR
jgi:hypothetical protein